MMQISKFIFYNTDWNAIKLRVYRQVHLNFFVILFVNLRMASNMLYSSYVLYFIAFGCQLFVIHWFLYHFTDVLIGLLKRHFISLDFWSGEGNGTPLQSSCLENPMDGGAWWAAVHGVAEGWTQLSNFTFTFHFHALEKEMETHSSVLAWRIPGMGEPGGLPSMGSHRVGHDWSDLAAAAFWRRRHAKEASVEICLYMKYECILKWGKKL